MTSPVQPVILLVDDDVDVAAMYKLQLEAGGYEVIVARDAQGGLDALDDLRIKAIILDILLPEHNGLGVLHELRGYEDWRALPVVVLSSLAERQVGLTPSLKKQLGIRYYLDKTRTTQRDLLAILAKLKLKP